MELAMDQGNPNPHVLVFPFSGIGHVNPMLKLAQLLSVSGIRVTFLNFDSNHHLLSNIDLGFQFRFISDGLPPDHPRTADVIGEMFESMKATTGPLLRDLLLSYIQEEQPVTCIIADGLMMSYVPDVGLELGVPVIGFRVISACAFWAFFCVPDMVHAGELPFTGENMDIGIRSVPGMEAFLRRRDLPSFCRGKERLDEMTNRNVINETRNTSRASALILNTFEELDGPILAHIRSHCPNTYTLGPLHSLLRSKLPSAEDVLNFTLQGEDKSYLTWLDAQPAKSVIYISFGSYTLLTHSELMEFWHGLANSGYRFLWARRSDMVLSRDDKEVAPELVEITRERGCVVEWAPQQEVLSHPAVGGFLTHSGWNSTLESIDAGVPMLCWPFFADQQVNSRFVEVVWKVGLDMKDKCDRKTVEKMVVELMERREFKVSARRWSEVAAAAIAGGGSSSTNLDKLVDDITSMRLPPPKPNQPLA